MRDTIPPRVDPVLKHLELTTRDLLEEDVAGALIETLETTGDATLVVHSLASLRETVAALKDLDASLVRALGMRSRTVGEGQGQTGAYSWEVHGGRNRTAWDHDAWKHDARAKVVESLIETVVHDNIETVDPETGIIQARPLNTLLQEAMTLLQEFHGAGQPRVGTMKKHGLDPDDYCETNPGPYTITINPNLTEDGPDA